MRIAKHFPSWMSGALFIATLLLPSLVGTQSASAQSVSNNFEGLSYRDWGVVGSAGFDIGSRWTWSGGNNGWIRASTGWNALYLKPTLRITSAAHTNKYLTAYTFIQGSPNVSNIFVSIVDANTGEVLSEQRYNAPDLMGGGYTYKDVIMYLSTPRWLDRDVRFRVGFWGNGQDAWLRVDDSGLSVSDRR